MAKSYRVWAADAITSLGESSEETWRRMLNMECGIRPLRRLAQRRYQTNVAAEILPEVEESARAGMSSGESRAYVLAMATARRTLKQAGSPKGRTGLVLATTKAGVDELERHAGGAHGEGRRHYLPSVMATDLAAELHLDGPVSAVSNACASGLTAVMEAARILDSAPCDHVLVVGVDIVSDFVLAGFSSLKALSPLPCRPFDKSRDGLSLGEGAGAILLAKGDGPRTLAVIRGWAAANDATHITAPSRTGAGLTAALVNALNASGLAPRDIDYVNAHGTGTVFNDETEAMAIHSTFGPTVPVSSMKGYLGHTLGAAGVIEMCLCFLALRDKVIPASMGSQDIGVSSPIQVAARHQRVSRMNHIVSIKCGFGGMNAAIILSGAGHD
jgi:3-oxoacyl-(acyl-carrier-protein) synthase